MERRTPELTARRNRPTLLASGFVGLDTIVGDKVVSYAAGGTAANVAAALAYFGWNAGVAAVVGDDAAGRRLRRDLRSAGVDIRNVRTERNVSTPQVIQEVDGVRHRFVFRCSDCGRKLPKSIPPPDTFAKELGDEGETPDVFFFDRASRFAVDLARRYAAAGAFIVFEPATRGRDALVNEARQIAHLVKMSHEAPFVEERRVATSQRQVIIVTDGSRGATVSAGSREIKLDAFEHVDVVDTAGAGDWTTAFFLHRLLTDDISRRTFTMSALKEALLWAQAVGALSCEFRGARGLSSHMTSARVYREADRLLAGRRQWKHGEEKARRLRRVSGGCRLCLAPISSAVA